MKKFDVEITETLQRTVSVEAASQEEAERMVTENTGLIWSVARRFFGRGVEPDDLYQLGCLGFLKAVAGFDLKISIGTDLKDLQDAVGGTITATYPFTDPVAIVCNDEGKLLGLPMNRALRDEHGQTYDVVAGNFLVVGLGEEDFASLSPELAQKYEQFFHQPETFVKLGSHLVILPTPDEAVQPAEEKSHIKPPAEHDR